MLRHAPQGRARQGEKAKAREMIANNHPGRINSPPFLGRTNPPMADFIRATAQWLTEI
jgi:hypothetical protein